MNGHKNTHVLAPVKTLKVQRKYICTYILKYMLFYI